MPQTRSRFFKIKNDKSLSTALPIVPFEKLISVASGCYAYFCRSAALAFGTAFAKTNTIQRNDLLSGTMYRLVCSHLETGPTENTRRPVYLQDWWLNITAPLPNLDQLIGDHRLNISENGVVVGTMTYTIFRNRLGVKQGRDPVLSRVGGPIIFNDNGGCEGDAVSRQRRHDKIASQLIAQLPLNVSHIFTLPPDSTDHTLFMDAGFEYDFEYSYRIPPGDAAKIRAGFFPKMRSRLRKAERELDVAVATPEQFIEFYAANLKAAGLRPVFPFDIAYKLLQEGLRRDQARITIAHYKGATAPVAALAAVWDADCYYSWLATYRRPEKSQSLKRVGRHALAMLAGHTFSFSNREPAANAERTSHPCAVRLLLWNAMLDAHSRGLMFDLDGTRKTETEHLYKEFNGLRVVRHILSRETPAYKCWTAVRKPIMAVLKNSVGLFGPFFY